MENVYIDAIKTLVNAHYEHKISLEEYRTKRRQLIDQMDKEFNGLTPTPQVMSLSINTSG
ncbi:hypothetical protein [Cellvibrio sp. PSBB023]|uniref:hypothetical protein n=1 Tax=Cellvibrio sp. PSBB023 TaxID=1945512 RepID=UPI00098F883E|nr:hypothetical protein [Cellvibrio sp. PSBB023]AQT61198.1 hypothetical protein B0D95_14640 [Cellvibrio sp. PSBB023]